MMQLGAIHRPAPRMVPAFANRARTALMIPPPRADWYAKCPVDGDPLGNDVCGDCDPAAVLRLIQLRRANALGDTWHPTREMAIGRYTMLTSYDPRTGADDNGTPTDADLVDWCTHGIQINDQDIDVPHWLRVDPLNGAEVSIAIGHMGGVLVTLNLPKAAQDLNNWSGPPGIGPLWDPGSWGEHRVVVGKFEGTLRVARTWGLDVVMHPDFWNRYVLAVDIAVSRGFLGATGLTPSGFDWTALSNDMASLVQLYPQEA